MDLQVFSTTAIVTIYYALRQLGSMPLIRKRGFAMAFFGYSPAYRGNPWRRSVTTR